MLGKPWGQGRFDAEGARDSHEETLPMDSLARQHFAAGGVYRRATDSGTACVCASDDTGAHRDNAARGAG
jgi:hypothetical protein